MKSSVNAGDVVEILGALLEGENVQITTEVEVTDVLVPEGCLRVTFGDRIFHIVVEEIDENGNEV